MITNINSSTHFKQVIESNKLVVVDFYADWCGPCKMLSPIMERLSEEFKNVTFLKVNVDNNSDLAQTVGIVSIPAVFFYKSNKVVNNFVGFRPYEETKKVIYKFIK